MTAINSGDTDLGYPIFMGQAGWRELENFISGRSARIAILTDEKTYRHCLPLARSRMPLLHGGVSFTIPSGEQYKNIETCTEIWNWLLKEKADRDTILVNLGGGVVMDMGGFAAASFRRGIPFINIPTSLIGQADAAVGGKVGLNFRNVKNQLGLFYNPAAVMVDATFLETLDPEQFLSGMGEVFKASILSGHENWQLFRDSFNAGRKVMEELVPRTLEYKLAVVRKDPKETGLRKVLNFGHTIGHAMESFSLMNGTEVPHGVAVAAGIACESFISVRHAGLDEDSLAAISATEAMHFPGVLLTPPDISLLIDLMRKDKKNRGSRILMSLIRDFGDPVTDIHCPEELISESLEFYIEHRGR